MGKKRFDLPGIDQKLDPRIRKPLERMKQALQALLGYGGDPDLAALTLGDARGGALDAIIVKASDDTDLTPPPTPTGLAVSSAISHVFVEWDPPAYTQGGGHGQTNIYGVQRDPASTDPEPTFGDAVPVYTAPGFLTVAALPSDPSRKWFIWIKWQSLDGVESTSPAGGTNGAQTTTGLDVDRLVAAMTGTGNPFTILAVDTTIDGVLYPAGTYSTLALIMDAQISRAKIKDAAIDDGKVANLSAAKLTVGDGTVGGDLKSTVYTSGSAGWRIRPNGTAEFNNVTVRGGIYATFGLIGGAVIDADGVQSVGYVAGTAGWRIDNTTEVAEFYDIIARGDIKANSIEVGSSPAISGTTMTGSGAVINDDGTFAIGNSTGNVSFDGSVLTVNGEIVKTENLPVETVTTTAGAALASDLTLSTSGTQVLSVSIDPEELPLYVQTNYRIERATGGGGGTSSLCTASLQINGSTYSSAEYVSAGDATHDGSLAHYMASPPSGPLTVRLYVVPGTGEYEAIAGACSIFAIGAKR